jgi:hypothetical protein
MLEMEMRHKHADLIHAWAEGAEIEIRRDKDTPWDKTASPKWYYEFEYRIKPTPKPDRVCKFEIAKDGTIWLNPDGANIKLTFDGETGELKFAEVLK